MLVVASLIVVFPLKPLPCAVYTSTSIYIVVPNWVPAAQTVSCADRATGPTIVCELCTSSLDTNECMPCVTTKTTRIYPTTVYLFISIHVSARLFVRMNAIFTNIFRAEATNLLDPPDPSPQNVINVDVLGLQYFFSTVMQFQLYRSMCRAAGQYVPDDPKKPLHKCDIYRQPKAGNILKQLMAKGASQPWQEVLQDTLGEGRLDGSALREYFSPLEEWLRLEALRTNEYVGWNYDGDYCKRSIETAGLQIFGGYYNRATGFGVNVFFVVIVWLCSCLTFF